MGGEPPTRLTAPAGAVFLSYASQDAGAARSICESLRAAGVEVWFDQSELRGGEAWDRQIRKQIHDCALFIPVISANAHARVEGYFRLEWKLAIDRSHLMAPDQTFLLPVVIDGTPQADERIPERFQELQWSRLPGGRASPEFIERVRRLLSPAQAHTAADLRPRVASAPGGARPAREPRGVSMRPVLVAMAVVVVAALAYLAVERHWLTKRTAALAAIAPSQSPAVAQKSIAVLPFADMSDKHDQEYFADGMAEEVLDLLASIPGLKVIGRTSSFQFKGKNQDLRAVGTALGARYVVEGSVRKSGERVRVTAQLIDSQDGAHVWSDSYDQPVGDTLKLQDQIAASLVRALQVSIGADQEPGRDSFRSSAAYDLYLRGRQAMERQDKEGLESGAAYFQQALDVEPSAVPALEWLSAAQMNLAAFSYVAPQPGFERARSSAERALALDPRSWAARLTLSSVHLGYDWDWAGAEREANEALRLMPRHPDTLSQLAQVYLALGRWDDGVRLTQASLAADPFNAALHLQLSNFRGATGRFTEAEAELRRMLQLSPTFAEARFDLGGLLLLQGKLPAALAEMQQEQTDASRHEGLAMVYHAMGRHAESDRALAEAVKVGAQGYASEIADVYAYRGDADRAFAWLERAYRQKDPGLYQIKSDTFLGSVRNDPRYAAFLRKMKLPE
ncbi:MAG: TIR domain-containing protein [Gammaproteobacteria bacterium]|nr:TIR domain-containing protein [Gammaproteobacteria bacterium]